MPEALTGLAAAIITMTVVITVGYFSILGGMLYRFNTLTEERKVLYRDFIIGAIGLSRTQLLGVQRQQPQLVVWVASLVALLLGVWLPVVITFSGFMAIWVFHNKIQGAIYG